MDDQNFSRKKIFFVLEDSNQLAPIIKNPLAGGLAPDILYLFQLQKEKAVWSEVDVVGESPTKRYGHT
jgi:hypothetical protein